MTQNELFNEIKVNYKSVNSPRRLVHSSLKTKCMLRKWFEHGMITQEDFDAGSVFNNELFCRLYMKIEGYKHENSNT